MANILLIEPLQSVARQIMTWLLRDGHGYYWSISGRLGVKAWLATNLKFDTLLMNFESDDWNATEVLAVLLGKNRMPQHAVIYFESSITPEELADRVQELEPLIPPSVSLVLLHQGGDFDLKSRLAIASIPVTSQKEEVQ